jgi:hypothetical protein
LSREYALRKKKEGRRFAAWSLSICMRPYITRYSGSCLVRNDHCLAEAHGDGKPYFNCSFLLQRASTVVASIRMDGCQPANQQPLPLDSAESEKTPIEVLLASLSNVSHLGQTLRFRRHKVVVFHLDAPSSQAGVRNRKGST